MHSVGYEAELNVIKKNESGVILVAVVAVVTAVIVDNPMLY